MKRLLCLAALLAMGCQWGGNLDRAQFEAHQKYYDASDGLLLASTQFLKASDQMAEKKHTIQAQHTTEAWNRWLATHTDKKGQIQASATQLTEVVEELEKRRRICRESGAGWAKISNSWAVTLKRFQNVNTTLRAKDVQWQEIKESAAAAFNAAIQSVATTAAGIGIGAAL